MIKVPFRNLKKEKIMSNNLHSSHQLNNESFVLRKIERFKTKA